MTEEGGGSEHLFSVPEKQHWTHVQLWTDMAGDSETPPPWLQDDSLGAMGCFWPTSHQAGKKARTKPPLQEAQTIQTLGQVQEPRTQWSTGQKDIINVHFPKT